DSYKVTIARWRSRVAARSSPPSPTYDSPPTIVASSIDIILPIVAPLGFHLSLDASSDSSSDHSVSDLSLDASSDSSSDHSVSGQSLSGHSSPDTTIDESPTPSRFVYPPSKTPRDREAYRCWRSATILSCKRCRSPATTIPLFVLTSGALVLTHADLLPSYKRFRYSYSPEDSIEEDIDTGVLIDIEPDTMATEAATAMEVEAGINARVDGEDENKEETESSSRGTVEIGMDRVIEPVVVDDITEPTREDYPDLVNVMDLERILDIKVGQRKLEASCSISNGERVGMLEKTMCLERENLKLRALLHIEI
nr:hypothetical protein [Tanacetum cinerariifolium]